MNMNLINKRMIREDNLSEYASKDSDAIRFLPLEMDMRPNYFRDIDRVIYSLSYSRYVDKTQVFTVEKGDHISRRMIHVQFVSKVARTIGRALGLNEDLIEATALAHDIGHVPFGHEGEKILNNISLKNNEGVFLHNVQSVRTMMTLEKNGIGNNLTIQVLDGVLCHNGEQFLKEYKTTKKTKEQFLEEYNNCYKEKSYSANLTPMTLEACVVRISDGIAYLGRDIEDAIRLNMLKYEDIPSEITDVLGKTNGEMIDTMINDVIKESFGKSSIRLSDKVFDAMNKLKAFNYLNVYNKSNSDNIMKNYQLMFNKVFETNLKNLKDKNINTRIYKIYLNNMNDDYKTNNSKERIVIDYIAGMTDEFFKEEYANLK